jgi:hypothetical protein
VTRHPALLVALAGLTVASACDFGSDPLGVGLRRPLPLAIEPVFAVVPTYAEISVLDHLRVTLRSPGNGSVVQTETVAIDPSDDEWKIELTVEAGPAGGRGMDLYLETELIDADGTPESVEWSGRTQPFHLQASDRQFRRVSLFRGPLANLDLRAVHFSLGAIRMVEGATARVTWIAEGDTTGTALYLAIENEAIATVDSSGRLQTRGVGATKLLVFGGTVKDSMTVEVTEVYLPPESEILDGIKPQLDYVSSALFIGTFHDQVGAEAIRTPITNLNAHLQLRDGPAAVTDLEAVKVAYDEYGRAFGGVNRYEDGPQLGVIELTLQRVATALHTAFP